MSRIIKNNGRPEIPVNLEREIISRVTMNSGAPSVHGPGTWEYISSLPSAYEPRPAFRHENISNLAKIKSIKTRSSYPTVVHSQKNTGIPYIGSLPSDLSFSTCAVENVPSPSTQDLPFSLSFWWKPSSRVINNSLVYKLCNFKSVGAGVPDICIDFRVGVSNQQIQAVLTDDGTGGKITLLSTLSVKWNPDSWNLITVTYEGNKAHTGIKTFANGELVPGFSSLSGTYNGIKNLTGGEASLNAYAYETDPVEASYAAGDSSIGDFVIYKRALLANEIRALYKSNISGEILTGYLNNPPRTILHTRDSATGSYPTIRRTTGFRIEKVDNPFDDSRAIDCNKTVSIHPFGLSKRDAIRYGNNFVSSPSTFATSSLGGALTSNIRITPGLSPELDRSFHQPGKFTPFDESRIYLEDTKFYKTGTPYSVVPGFSSPLKDKIQIKIDIPNSDISPNGSIMSRWNQAGIPAGMNDEEGELNGRVFTGFRYYNFAQRGWTQKGILDPVDHSLINPKMFFLFDGTRLGSYGTSSDFFSHITYDPKGHLIPDGTALMNKHKMYQFGMSPQLGYMAKSMKELKDMAYDKIGAPTMAGMAPNVSNLYHAPTDQQLKMSDYISHPFLLEKAVIEIPVTARRRNGNFHPSDPGFEEKVNGGNRDIDNYVFFVYRQSNPNLDIADGEPDVMHQYVTGSRRNIIMSASVSFYNSQVFNQDIRDEILADGLPHNPNFSHDFNATISGSGDPGDVVGVISAFTGTLRIEMTPAVANGGRRAGSRFPIYAENGGATTAAAWPTLLWQDFWLGGTDFSISRDNFFEAIDFGGQNKEGLLNILNNNADVPSTSRQLGYGNSFHAMWKQGDSFHSTLNSQATIPKDQRPLRNFTGFNDMNNIQFLANYPSEEAVVTCKGISKTPTGSNKSNLAVSTPSPYLLLPDDSLVFGIDAGISMLPMSGVLGQGIVGLSSTFDPDGPEIFGNAPLNSPQEALSGSYMRIERGNASITLYGSMISHGKERLFDLNQNLTSDAVHEALHFDNPVVDQFDIHNKHAYSGSYIDNLVFGQIKALKLPAGMYLDKMIPFGNEFFDQKLPRGVYGSLGSDSPRGIEKYYSYDPDQDKSDSKGGVQSDPYGLASWNASAAKNSSRNSLLRANKVLDKSERWYDTIMPDIKDFADRCGMLAAGGVQHSAGLTVIGTLNGLLNEWPTGSPTDYAANKKAKPYDTRVERSVWSLANIKFRIDGNSSATPGSGVKSIVGAVKNAASTLSNHVVFNTIMFGKGYKIKFQGDVQDTSSIRFVPPYSTGSTLVPNSTPYGACGYLYGIQSVRPAYSSMYFRYNKFGQFRDMLEQRKDGKFHKTASPAREVDAPIQCVFVERENGYVEVSPYQTDSGNMSIECTASAPFTETGVHTLRLPGLIVIGKTAGRMIDSSYAYAEAMPPLAMVYLT